MPDEISDESSSRSSKRLKEQQRSAKLLLQIRQQRIQKEVEL